MTAVSPTALGTGEIRLLLKNASDAERALIHEVEAVKLPPNTLWMHDYSGDFGVHTPGLAAAQDGTLVASCIRRHDSNSDGGHDGDILTCSSQNGGASWSRQAVAYAESGVLFYLGPIVAVNTTAAATVDKLLLPFWKIPHTVTDDTGKFSRFSARRSLHLK